MKKIILVLALLLFSCTSKKTLDIKEIKEVNEFPSWTIPITYKIIIIDSCEYIIGSDNGGYNGGFFLTHKGNCKNPIHKNGK
jgi:hypothetical protein